MDVKMSSQLLECGLCLDIYHDPRILLCGHTFCLNCLQKQSNAQEERMSLSCALCRSPWSAPDNDIRKLMKNIVIDSLVSSQSIQNVKKCSLDDNEVGHENVEYVCIDCWDLFCEACGQRHTKYSKQTKWHLIKKIVNIDETDIEKHDYELISKCSKHRDKNLELFCTECNRSICYLCCVTSHCGHKCKELSEIDEMLIAAIEFISKECQKSEAHYNMYISNLKEAINDVENKFESNIAVLNRNVSLAQDKINRMVSALFADLERYKLDETERFLTTKTKNVLKLSKPLEDMLLKQRKLQKINRLCEKTLSPSASVINRASFVENFNKDILKLSAIDIDV